MKLTGRDSVTLFNDHDAVMQKHTARIKQLFAKGLEEGGEGGAAAAGAIPTEPKPEDFAFFQWRHLSAAIVGGNSWKATDFTVGDVLKNSLPLLQGRPAYLNHQLYVGNEIGTVGDTIWTPSYVNSEGVEIPGGIDAPFVIDKVLFPKLVRQLNSPTSPIDSASVTVFYEWEASHEFERESDFYWHLGEMVDGSMVRRMAGQITSFAESSLVWSGADPYAKKHVGGEVVGVDRAGIFSKGTAKTNPLVEEYLREYMDTRRYYVFNTHDAGRAASFEKSALNLNPDNHQKPNTMNKELLAFLAVMFGKETLTEQEAQGLLTKENLAGFKALKLEDFNSLSAAKEKATQVETLTAAKTQLEGEKQTLTDQVAQLTRDVEANTTLAGFGKTFVDGLRTEAKELYNKFAKGNPDATIVASLEKADVATLEANVKMWGGSLYSSFGASCGDCKSANIVMRSSVAGDEGKTTKAPAGFSLAEARL